MAVEKYIIRKRFAELLSKAFQADVPEYGRFVDIVRTSNEAFLNEKYAALDEASRAALVEKELREVMEEKHGAIRCGANEIATVARIFAVMGMEPVNFYDLTTSKIPVVSTAFRDTNPDTLGISPFRMFSSVLYTDDEAFFTATQKSRIDEILQQRQIFKGREKLLSLVEKAERDGGLEEEDVAEFLTEAVKVFSKERNHIVDFHLYSEMLHSSDVAADIVALGYFIPVIPINHLTPKVFAIDDAFKSLNSGGLATIAEVQGPPKRENEQALPLLQQTSIKSHGEYVYALSPKLLEYLKQNPQAGIDELCAHFKIDKEKIIKVEPDRPDQKGLEYLRKVEQKFEQGEQIVMFKHKARFGEIESRGVALSQKGREQYDQMDKSQYLSSFPKTHLELFEQGLAYYKFSIADLEKLRVLNIDPRADMGRQDVVKLVKAGIVELTPVNFEDFLPKSAAGIFRSNLSAEAELHESGQENPELVKKEFFEKALGKPVKDSYELYENSQQKSFDELRGSIRLVKGVTSPALSRKLSVKKQADLSLVNS